MKEDGVFGLTLAGFMHNNNRDSDNRLGDTNKGVDFLFYFSEDP